MGCNYYVQYKQDSGWYEQVHIGKSSMGWKFLFKGYVDEWNSEPPIRSKKNWVDFVESVNGEIFDEYHRKVDDFWGLVENKQDGIDHVRKAKEDGYYTEDYWQDNDGYDFCCRDFC